MHRIFTEILSMETTIINSFLRKILEIFFMSIKQKYKLLNFLAKARFCLPPFYILFFIVNTTESGYWCISLQKELSCSFSWLCSSPLHREIPHILLSLFFIDRPSGCFCCFTSQTILQQTTS